MRYIAPIFFLLLVLLALQSWFTNFRQAGPSQEAKTFLLDIQSGNLSKIVRHFGNNICHCPKKNGWGSFLTYQPGEEPNLAFLVGKPFKIGKTVIKKVESPPQAYHGVPWENPEDYLLDTVLQFDSSKYRPVFLPLPMAYGKKMSWDELENFVAHPDIDAQKNFSLRLRTSIETDITAFDTSTIQPDVQGEFKFLKIKGNQPRTEKDYPANIKDLLKKASSIETKTLLPQNAGIVLLPDGSSVSNEKVESILPHLNMLTVRFRVVRRSSLEPWTVSRFSFMSAVLDTNDGNKLISLQN